MNNQREEMRSAIQKLDANVHSLSETATAFQNRVNRISSSAHAWLKKMPCPPNLFKKTVDPK